MRWLVYPLLLILILTAGCDVLPFGGNELPVAYIDSISPSEAAAGDVVTFVGHGTDADGTVVGYKWRSDADGDLSSMGTFNSAELSEGYHTIYLSVQDNNGDWSEEVSSNITVGAGGSAEEGAFDVESETTSESSGSGTLPYINYLTAEPAVVAPGGASVIRWSVSNAQQVIGSYDSTVLVLPATGSGTVRPTRTTVYTVSATSGASTVSATVTVTVTAGGSSSADDSGAAESTGTGNLPVFNSVIVTPSTIDPGGTAIITFDVSNATSLTLTSPTGTKSMTSMSGSIEVAPASTTTYTFTATNAAGSVNETATVNVSGPPLAEGIGVVEDSDWKTTNLSKVSSESGNINSDHVVSTKIVAGDSASNKPYRAFVSFNISSLAGKEIQKAELLSQTGILGSPWAGLGTLGIYRVSYGPRALRSTDYSITGPSIVLNLPQSALSGPINVTSAVRAAVASHDSRFQVRLNFVKGTDNDNKADNCSWTGAILKVTYR